MSLLLLDLDLSQGYMEAVLHIMSHSRHKYGLWLMYDPTHSDMNQDYSRNVTDLSFTMMHITMNSPEPKGKELDFKCLKCQEGHKI